MRSVGRWATAGVVILFGLLGARDVYARGDTGHQIICEIAFQELNTQARAQVKQLLQHDPDFTRFSKACTWPDRPRKRASEHFVNLSRTATLIGDDPCPLDDRCVVTAIEADGAVLSQPSASEMDRLAALKFIGHGVGDVDLRGSMELLADRDPEEARQLLDPVLERMMAAVHRYEGTVNQVMGDGIMALFGAPIAHEDHAVRACYAALAMQEAIHRYSDEVRRTYGLEVQIRVGLNSGEVVVRTIGNDLHMD
jgi:hypothetical protein